MANFKHVKAYEKHQFSSGSAVGPDFVGLAKKLKSYIQDICNENGFEMLKFNRGHYDCSGYVRHIPTGRMVYWAIRDVRVLYGDWYNRVLYRRASKVGDCSGFNMYSNMEKLDDAIVGIIDIENKWSRNKLMETGREIALSNDAIFRNFQFDHENQRMLFNCVTEDGNAEVFTKNYSEF